MKRKFNIHHFNMIIWATTTVVLILTCMITSINPIIPFTLYGMVVVLNESVISKCTCGDDDEQ